MRFEVPQFIEIEDKIFGPLTWRQFLYLGGGVGMSVVMFFTFPFTAFVLIGLPLGILSGALAFYPINSRPFSFFLEAIFNYLSHKRLYFWRQKTSIIRRGVEVEKAPIDSLTKARSSVGKKNLSSLARKLELDAIQKAE